MARRPFGGGAADFVARVTGGSLVVGSYPVTFWTAATGGSQITDLLNTLGAAASSINTDSNGQIPSFSGPNDASAFMWADGGGSARQLLYSTDTPARLTSLEAAACASAGFSIVGPKNANYTAAVNEFVTWDTTAASYVQTLPNAPANGTLVGGKIVILGAGHTVTIACGGSDVFNRTGGPTSLTLSLVDQAFQMEYKSGIWTVTGVDVTLGQMDARYDAIGAATAASGASLQKTSNLSDLASAATARTNLGLGTAATTAASAYDAAGAAAAVTTTSIGAATTGALTTETSRATTAEGLAAQKASNLSDLASASSARTNLGLGTAATSASSAFDAAGAATTAGAAATASALQKTSNLSDVASVSAARTNLGLGTAATTDASAYDVAGAAAAVFIPGPQPVDHGFLAYSEEPIVISGIVPTAGVVYSQRIRVHGGMTISYVCVPIFAVSTSATNSYAALFNSALSAQLALSADASTAVNAAAANSWVDFALTTPYVVPGTVDVYVEAAFLFGGGTAPSIGRVGTSGLINRSGNRRYTTSGTGQTSMPSSLASPANQTSPIIVGLK